MDRDAALPLLTYDPERTYAELDGTTAAELLDSLRLPDRARAMLFEVFSHSFFNHEREMSAAEMVANFHFYLLGNREGLAFDAPDEDYADGDLAAAARPLETARRAGGHRQPRHAAAPRRRRLAGAHRATGGRTGGDQVVLAVDPPALAALVAASPQVAAAAPALAPRNWPPSARPGPPYAVARYWLDGDVAARARRCSAGCPASPPWTR